MRKKTLASILTFTIVLTLFAFCALYLTRPESNSYSLKILEEARLRQKSSLISVSAPLETDVTQLTQEERIAIKVAEILSSDALFVSDVKDVLLEDVESSMELLGEDIRTSVLSEAGQQIDEGYASALKDAAAYSDKAAEKAIAAADDNAQALILESEARETALIDSKIDAFFNGPVKDYVSSEGKAYSASDRAYADLQASKAASTAAEKIANDSSFIRDISDAVVSRLGFADDGEYILQIDRLVDEVFQSALSDPEIATIFESAINRYYLENSEDIYNAHVSRFLNSVKELSDEEVYQLFGIDPFVDSSAEAPSGKLELIPTDLIEQPQGAVVTEVVELPETKKERVSAPVFGIPNTSLTDDDIVVERDKQRNEELERIREWLGE